MQLEGVVKSALARGELTPELMERFAWKILIGRDRSVNAFALPGGYLGVHLGLIGVVNVLAQFSYRLRRQRLVGHAGKFGIRLQQAHHLAVDLGVGG